MIYSKKALEKAIYYLLPEIIKIKNKIINFDNPEFINMISKKYFLEKGGDVNNFKEQMAYIVAREAAKDLYYIGYFKFGKNNCIDLD